MMPLYCKGVTTSEQKAEKQIRSTDTGQVTHKILMSKDLLLVSRLRLRDEEDQ